jgi:class 3 adenylate cyclase/tetratricopeptide (TPR) repeat protein
MKCPQCGAENQPKNKFCPECGFNLQAAPQLNRIELVKKEIPESLVHKIKLTKDSIQKERRNVSVAFTDISGFTTMSELLDPEELTLLMNECFKKLSMMVYRYEGIIDKFIGDCIMAIFGAPISHEDDPERAILACLDMQLALNEINHRLEKSIKKLAIHSGINTGEVIAGKIGSDLQMEYTVMGDTVNVAQRLKDIASPGTILVGPETYQRAKHAFDFLTRDPVSLKGKADTVKPFEVIGRKWGSEYGLSAFRSDLVGRDGEFDRLKAGLKDLLNGRASIFLIRGDIGVGKSRLLYEFKKYLAVTAPNLTLFDDRGLSYESSIPFKSFSDCIARYLTAHLPGTGAEPERFVRLRVHELLGVEAEEIGPYLYKLLGFELTEPEADKIRFLDGHSLQLQIFLAVAALFEKISAATPAVIIIDDIQWYDSASLELINFLLAGVRKNNIIFILSYRLGSVAPIQKFLDQIQADYKDYTAEIGLTNLAPGDSLRLIDNLVGGKVSPPLKTFIIEKSSGNPFFIEEIIRNIIESGKLAQPGDLKEKDIQIPGSIDAAVTSRIDGLDKEAKYILKIAAIIGRSFPRALLEEIVKEKDIIVHVNDLEQAEFLVRITKDGQPYYAFRHPLFQEVGYNSILKSERVIYHKIIAETIEARFSDRLEGYYSILAEHYYQCQNLTKAVEYSIKAGDEAAALFANSEALRHYETVLHNIADLPARCAVLEKIADIQFLTGQVEEARRNYQTVRETVQEPVAAARVAGQIARILENTGQIDESIALLEKTIKDISHLESPVLVKLYHELATVLLEAKADYQRALDLIDSGIRIADRIGDKLLMADSIRMKGHALYRSGAGREALAVLLDAQKLYETQNDQAGLTALYVLMASVCRMVGDLNQAIAYGQKGIEGNQRIGNRRMVAVGYNNLGTYYDLAGDWKNALNYYEKNLEIRKTLGDKKGEAIAYSNMGILKHQRGETDAALEYYLKTKEIMEQINDVRGMIHTYLSLARIHISRDQKENTAAYLDRALAMARTTNDRLLLSDVYNDYAQFHADYDELDQAETALDSAAELVRSEQDKFRLLYLLLTQADYFFLRKDSTALKYAEEAVRVAREIKTRPDEANALRTLGKIQALLNGDYAGGTENIRRSLAIAEEAGLVMVIPQCLKALGEVLAAEGKPGPARQNLDQARVRFQQTGAVREVRKIDAILSSTP